MIAFVPCAIIRWIPLADILETLRDCFLQGLLHLERGLVLVNERGGVVIVEAANAGEYVLRLGADTLAPAMR